MSFGLAVTPTALQGRVVATSWLLSAGTMALGALAGGALGQRIGLQPTLVLAASGEMLSPAHLARAQARSGMAGTSES